MQRSTGIRFLLEKQGPLLALIAVISVTYGLQVLLDRSAFDSFMVVPAEIVASWNAMRAGDFSAAGVFDIIPLLSYAFLHGGLDHLLFNMLYLWMFAALASELLGWRWMLFSFAFTAICGGVFHTTLNPVETIPMLGASGAVTGFEGLYLGMAARWQLPNPHVWPMSRPIPPGQLAALGVMGLGMDFMGFMGGTLGVAYGAHLGGFIGGMVLGTMIVPMPMAAHRR